MSKLPIPVTNVTVLTPEYGGWSISADYLDAHYHYWVAAGDETLTPRDNILYRTPQGQTFSVFKRKIDKNIALVDAMRAAAFRTNAVAAGRQQVADAQAKCEAGARERAIANHLEHVRALAAMLDLSLDSIPDTVILGRLTTMLQRTLVANRLPQSESVA